MGNKKRNKKMARRKLRQLRKTISATIPREKGAFKKNTVEKLSRLNDDQPSLQVLESPILPSTDEQPSLQVLGSTKSPILPSTSQFQNETEEICESPLVVEEENKEEDFESVSGRRIIDLNYFLTMLQEKARHSNIFDCKANNFRLIGEKRIGLISTFKFQCDMCQTICLIPSENTANTKKLNLNLAATAGIVASGSGYSQFEELCSSMDIPVFSPSYYNKLQNEIYDKWEKIAWTSMEAAAKKEKEFAIKEGRLKNGYPVIDVYVDGSWCARSYGSNYKASSGIAAIIGRRTGQILYIGVKNKYCLVCARAENKKTAPKEHICFKNYDGSSSSMETEILVEGFKSSISMYGLIYNRMIGDGDASTYAKILNANPYEAQNVTVEKIECRNHILRNFCKKLRAIKLETKYQLAYRKTLTNIRILSMRKVIVKSIKHHKSSATQKDVAVSLLHNDIVNSLAHVYRDHKMCQSHYCDKTENECDDLKNIQNSTFMFRISSIIASVAAKSRSLIEDVDTNIVECFNSVIAKFIGGKRTNLALKQGYQSRSSAAVVSFNTKSAVSSIHEAYTETNPGGRIEKIEKKRALKRKYFVEHPIKKKRVLKENNRTQHNYGPSSSAPDMPQEELELTKNEYLNNLKLLTCDKTAIERATVLQRDSSEWLEIRKKLITASNFGLICKRKPTSNTANLVKSILYQKKLAHVPSIAHGIENEKQALLQLQKQENVEILPCGLFIDTIYPFIGATPDGLIGDDTIVEVKCPITASKLGLSKAIAENKIQILKYNKQTKSHTINKTSNWYYQIQGQLHVTGRQTCLLGIWAGDKENLHTERIEKDDNFWTINMEPKLIKFYMNILLPELVDSRHKRGMPIRNLSSEDTENIEPNLQKQDPRTEDPKLGPSTRTLNFSDY